MMRKSFECGLALAAGAMMIACGPAAASDDDTRTFEEICAGAPKESSNGTVTLVGCPFEQQTDNIYKYGLAVDRATLFDATGASTATVTRACGSWWMGTDASSVTVIVDRTSGEVRSHGMFHAGQETSGLPGRLATPLTVR